MANPHIRESLICKDVTNICTTGCTLPCGMATYENVRLGCHAAYVERCSGGHRWVMCFGGLFVQLHHRTYVQRSRTTSLWWPHKYLLMVIPESTFQKRSSHSFCPLEDPNLALNFVLLFRTFLGNRCDQIIWAWWARMTQAHWPPRKEICITWWPLNHW